MIHEATYKMEANGWIAHNVHLDVENWVQNVFEIWVHKNSNEGIFETF